MKIFKWLRSRFHKPKVVYSISGEYWHDQEWEDEGSAWQEGRDDRD
jgi:hypothetical protein